MEAFKAICIALSTYSVIPVPRFDWTEENMRYSLCAFPVVGIFIGVLLYVWNWFCQFAGFGNVLFAAVATVIPLLVTGGIHMDGYCDTADALASHQPRERKLEIMKDPHTGAFAIIYCMVYLLVCFGFYTELAQTDAICIIGLGFLLSRALAALTAVTMPSARKNGMLAAYTNPLHKRTALAILCAVVSLVMATMLCMQLQIALFCLVGAFLWYLGYRAFAMHIFGGVTGDTTGFFTQILELVFLICAVLGLRFGGNL